MSIHRLNRNFQEFLQTIHNWPTSTIEKSTLIQLLDEFCNQNPELQHIYINLSVPEISHQSSNQNTDNDSRLDSTSTVIGQLNNNNHQSIINENSIIKKELNTLLNIPPNIISVKEGDLTVRKGSTILSPLLKKFGLKALIYCELSYTYNENEKLVYLIIYQTRKCRKILHKFIIDDTCSFIYENKRDFQFKHNSAIENFTTETGIADTWISSFKEVSIRKNIEVEEVYENPEEFSFIPESSLKNVLNIPMRPPPRPSQPTNSISPENIYVCLYDHNSTTNDSYELEFTCGDLLYIINNDGPNFYVGHRLILPLNNSNQMRIGLVFKDYIRPAYEKV